MAQNTPRVDPAAGVVRTPSPALDMRHSGLVEIEKWIRIGFDLLSRCRAVVEAGVPGHMYLMGSWPEQSVSEVCWLPHLEVAAGIRLCHTNRLHLYCLYGFVRLS